MKILNKVISELPFNDQNKYSIDINLLLKAFLDYEVDIPDNIYLKHQNKKLLGSTINYLENLENIKFLEHGNTYNWGGLINHDFNYLIASYNNFFYIAIQVNRGCDIRCNNYSSTNNNSYTDTFLLKFKDYQDFFELIDEVITENATFSIIVDNKTYLVTPQIQSDCLQVKCLDTDEGIDDVYASSDEEFIKQIRNCHKK